MTLTTGMVSSLSVEWGTPQALFDGLNAEFGFTLDVCATPGNAKCARYYSPADDGLRQEWAGVCWCNPPYGREIGKWVRKAFEAVQRGSTVVCLLPARTDTNWWHAYVMHGEVRFLRGRLYFNDGRGRAPFPSAVVVFRPRATKRGE